MRTRFVPLLAVLLFFAIPGTSGAAELVKTIGTGSWRRVVCNYVAAPASAG